ncbi:MAG: transposase [Gammaproteobacteria bacterium]|nr:transposase [Gammaproteobacteria bacterium]
MTEYRRAKTPGGTYFFTVCTRNRSQILTRDLVWQSLTEAFNSVRRKWPFYLNAWVVLPDHLHCLWTLPEGDSDFSKRWSMIKRIVTQRCEASSDFSLVSKNSRREGKIWQRRFWEHLVRSDDDYRLHLDYIHWNPVKHGYVNSAIAWRYSSFSRFVTRGIYDPDWGVAESTFESRRFGE